MPQTSWGVDSAAAVNNQVYDCVVTNYGKPEFWGRYLTTVPQAAEGLTPAEIAFLHQKGVKVMPIYSAFREATVYRNGQIAARNAIFNLQRLGFPKDTFVFANVEHFFLVDDGWIRGWVDTLYTSGYRPGFYHDPIKGDFRIAYCNAVKKDRKVAIQSVLWSAEPEPGITKKTDAPNYNPASPPCEANVWAWQYGRDSKVCPIDTNLIDNRLLNNLW